jgi:hypothetical protein
MDSSRIFCGNLSLSLIVFRRFISPLRLLEGLHRFLANHPAVSVIEEKGEGFENGKNDPWLLVA